ncbi:MAG: HIT domain-containing protein [Chloroflexi bacterium]|nr:HIT domain-containing protein [Chloroflexota bacterium]
MTMYCVFCEIIARRQPAKIRYEDDEVIVIDNILAWTPVMMLAMPKKHMGQEDLWRDMGKVGAVAVEMAEKHCPGGYRLLSNAGPDAMQSQYHAHVHILGGTFLGHYA